MCNIKIVAVLLFTILPTGGMCYGDGWPQFRGPNRDGKSAETGLLQKWPEGGPKLLWSVGGLGVGFSSAAVAKGRVYTTGMLDGEGFLFAYDLDGNFQWKVSRLVNRGLWLVIRGSIHYSRFTIHYSRFTSRGGGIMFELSSDGANATKKWSDQILDCHHGGVVLVDGYLYGSNFKGIPKGDWVCLEWDTGKVMYEAVWNGNKGSIIYADNMLYCYDENTGDVALVKASPRGFEIVSSFRITEGSGKHWAHPAISDGRLYIRHGDTLMAYDIKR